MKRAPLLSFCLVLAVGCGSRPPNLSGTQARTQPGSQAHNVGYGGPAEDLAGTPVTVAFVGDNITYEWISAEQATHPMWINAATDTTETTASMLARFPAVIAMHPQVINIMAGQGDVVEADSDGGTDDGTWVLPCGTVGTCANIAAMVAQAHAAGIYVMLGTTPLIYEPVLQVEEDMSIFNANLSGMFIDGKMPGANALVDYADSFPTDFSDDGNITNPTALLSLTNAAEKGIMLCKCGEVR